MSLSQLRDIAVIVVGILAVLLFSASHQTAFLYQSF